MGCSLSDVGKEMNAIYVQMLVYFSCSVVIVLARNVELQQNVSWKVTESGLNISTFQSVLQVLYGQISTCYSDTTNIAKWHLREACP